MVSKKTKCRYFGLGRGLAVALVAATLTFPSLSEAPTEKISALEGKLVATAEKCPMLKLPDREVPLSATTPYLLDTLQDKRLDNFEVRVEGAPQPDGSFEVKWLFTIHKGKLFRVRYFCAVCNIVGLGPGNCVCCQQPTELQEIPVNDTDKYLRPASEP